MSDATINVLTQLNTPRTDCLKEGTQEFRDLENKLIKRKYFSFVPNRVIRRNTNLARRIRPAAKFGAMSKEHKQLLVGLEKMCEQGLLVVVEDSWRSGMTVRPLEDFHAAKLNDGTYALVFATDPELYDRKSVESIDEENDDESSNAEAEDASTNLTSGKR